MQLAGRSLQQSDAEPFLQRRDSRAHRGIGHAKQLGGLIEAAGFHDFDENFDAVEIHGRRFYIRRKSVSKLGGLVEAAGNVYFKSIISMRQSKEISQWTNRFAFSASPAA